MTVKPTDEPEPFSDAWLRRRRAIYDQRARFHDFEDSEDGGSQLRYLREELHRDGGRVGTA